MKLPDIKKLIICLLLAAGMTLTGCTGKSLSAEDLRKQYEQEQLEMAARAESQEKEDSALKNRDVKPGKHSIDVFVNTDNDQKETLNVSFVDVGQGDCIYLRTAGHDMLIDSGSYDHAGDVIRFLKKQGAGNSIDIVIGTHPDADHIGGLPDILDHYKAGFLITPGVEKDTPAYFYLQESVIRNGIMEVHPAAGQSYALGNALVTIIGPATDTYSEVNNASIVCKVTYGSTSFLFTGDAETEEENSILQKGFDVSCDVLKLGHHGSSSSSGVSFLKAAAPRYAVISCGRNNDYGHPHEETMHTLEVMGIKTYRTDEQGTVTALSDGQSISWDQAPSETYVSG